MEPREDKKDKKDKKNKKHKKNGKAPKHLSNEELAAADLQVGDVKAKARDIKTKTYEKELARIQIELVKMQEWIKHEKLRVVVIFEGRDAAGKGGVIKRITERNKNAASKNA